MHTYPDMKITGRIVKDGETIGYTVVDTTGMTKKLRKANVIKLAQDGKFINALAHKISDDKWGLKGMEGENLSQLPIFKVKQ